MFIKTTVEGSENPNDWTMESCTYPVCASKTNHQTAVCYTLQEKCLRCRGRGHYAAICESRSQLAWQTLYEYYGPQGALSKLQKTNPEGGYKYDKKVN